MPCFYAPRRKRGWYLRPDGTFVRCLRPDDHDGRWRVRYFLPEQEASIGGFWLVDDYVAALTWTPIPASRIPEALRIDAQQAFRARAAARISAHRRE